jgi:hypothetical protein
MVLEEIAPCPCKPIRPSDREKYTDLLINKLIRNPAPLVPVGILFFFTIVPGARAEVVVRDPTQLRQAVLTAQPGTNILIAPGDYPGNLYFENIHGAPGKPIVIAALDPFNPPRITGGTEGIHFVDAAFLELRHLAIVGATDNGLNIDDGGTFDTPAHHIVLGDLKISHIGPKGNSDGIKLSGVTDFHIENCVVEFWGKNRGSAIDMVGCHRGVVKNCLFRHEDGSESTGVQAKGGSTDISILENRFEHAGGRAINIGGNTDLKFFRPRPQGFEAKNIRVEGNLFIGSIAPIAFVGIDGAVVHFNTIYRPKRWAVRILQETNGPGFVPSRNGVFTDNIIVFRSGEWHSGGVNIGPNTAPETFRFERNVWYCEDQPGQSKPQLPTREIDGIVGKNPLFMNSGKRNFSLKEGSPAQGKGHTSFRREAILG